MAINLNKLLLCCQVVGLFFFCLDVYAESNLELYGNIFEQGFSAPAERQTIDCNQYAASNLQGKFICQSIQVALDEKSTCEDSNEATLIYSVDAMVNPQHNSLCHDIKNYLHNKTCFFSSQNSFCALLDHLTDKKNCDDLSEEFKRGGFFNDNQYFALNNVEMCHVLSSQKFLKNIQDLRRTKPVTSMLDDSNFLLLHNNFLFYSRNRGANNSEISLNAKMTVERSDCLLNITQTINDLSTDSNFIGALFEHQDFLYEDLSESRVSISKEEIVHKDGWQLLLNKSKFFFRSKELRDKFASEVEQLNIACQDKQNDCLRTQLQERQHPEFYRGILSILKAQKTQISSTLTDHSSSIYQWGDDGKCYKVSIDPQSKSVTSVRSIDFSSSEFDSCKTVLASKIEWEESGFPTKTSVVSKKDLEQLFKSITNESDIPFNYALDQCFSRSFKIAKIAKEKLGLELGQVFAFAPHNHYLKVTNPLQPYEPIYFNYHVAPVVLTLGKLGELEPMVIDPTLYSERALTLEEWQGLMTAHDPELEKSVKTYYRDRFTWGPLGLSKISQGKYDQADIDNVERELESTRLKLATLQNPIRKSSDLSAITEKINKQKGKVYVVAIDPQVLKDSKERTEAPSDPTKQITPLDERLPGDMGMKWFKMEWGKFEPWQTFPQMLPSLNEVTPPPPSLTLLPPAPAPAPAPASFFQPMTFAPMMPPMQPWKF
ncbi:MAG: hypothetical protein HQK50_08115 [Oligoflexia bacterium]|nr:hypothetical protein [Oligoflexia bacterium]MBF0365522.1 hypothetical protein [Oligoflexia bacterium]